MSRRIMAAALLTLLSAPALATDVGVSVSISQPGVYGRVDIGRFPRPDVVVAQPVIVQPPRVVVVQPEPVYLWVPPGHRKDWRKHCAKYDACGQPVYFVRDEWYERHVRHHPHHQHRHRGKGHGKDRD